MQYISLSLTLCIQCACSASPGNHLLRSVSITCKYDCRQIKRSTFGKCINQLTSLPSRPSDSAGRHCICDLPSASGESICFRAHFVLLSETVSSFARQDLFISCQNTRHLRHTRPPFSRTQCARGATNVPHKYPVKWSTKLKLRRQISPVVAAVGPKKSRTLTPKF